MNKEHTEALLAAGPGLYGAGQKKSGGRVVPFYFACGDGWYELLLKLTRALQQEIELLPSASWDSYQATCVKEKFGTLRFYMSQETEPMAELIEQAELESAKTCEGCGKPGTLRDTKGWLSTQCDRCARGY